jgi:hypothetical protein
MGLAIGVGMVAELGRRDPAAADRMRQDLEAINERLKSAGLPTHQEPSDFDEPLKSRASISSFPYSWLHYLRRFAAHVMRAPRWVPYPIEPGEDPADDPVLRQMYRGLSSHLLCHSDSEGYYLPVDFHALILDPEQKLRGSVVGSSYRLREELLGLTEPLEIPVGGGGDLSDEAARSLAAQRPSGAPFAVERLVWLALFEAARLSIEHRTAIVFY